MRLSSDVNGCEGGFFQRVRVTEIDEVESYEYIVSVGVQQAVKVPLFEEFKNRGEMLTREMCFMPALTLTTWL